MNDYRRMDNDEEGVDRVEGEEEGVEGARLVTLYPSSHLLLVSQANTQHARVIIFGLLESGLDLQPRIWYNNIPKGL